MCKGIGPHDSLVAWNRHTHAIRNKMIGRILYISTQIAGAAYRISAHLQHFISTSSLDLRNLLSRGKGKIAEGLLLKTYCLRKLPRSPTSRRKRSRLDAMSTRVLGCWDTPKAPYIAIVCGAGTLSTPMVSTNLPSSIPHMGINNRADSDD
jgi:hypothetical protein